MPDGGLSNSATDRRLAGDPIGLDRSTKKPIDCLAAPPHLTQGTPLARALPNTVFFSADDAAGRGVAVP